MVEFHGVCIVTDGSNLFAPGVGVSFVRDGSCVVDAYSAVCLHHALCEELHACNVVYLHGPRKRRETGH